MSHLNKVFDIQRRAKLVLSRIADFIFEYSTERTIVKDCINLLAEQGITETWYYDVPALALLGSRSCLSISGKDYQPADEFVGEINLITIDLSPLDGNALGDCARSYVFESGKASQQSCSEPFLKGLKAEEILHQDLIRFAAPETTFEELFIHSNTLITDLGFENLDFLGNLGHSLVKDRSSRMFIEPGNRRKLDSVAYFTFEPHIKLKNDKWGYKYEDIYYFDDNGLLNRL